MIFIKMLSILQSLLYSGADRKFFIDRAALINVQNGKNLQLLCRFALFCFGIYLLIAPRFHPLRAANVLYTAYFLILLVFTILIERYLHAKATLPKVFCYVFSGLCLSYSILLGTVYNRNCAAVMFLVLSITLTTVFFFSVLESALLNLAAGLFFIFAAFRFKDFSFATIDLANWVISYLITCITAYSLSAARVNILKTREELECACNTDELTGLNNRRNMNHYLFEKYQKSPRLHVAILDIDDFKRYNDTYGHIQGDSCLQAVSTVLREKATQYGCYAARYGGEEFCIVDCKRTAAQISEILQDMLDSVTALGIRNENASQPCISLSAGIVSKEDYQTRNYIELLKLADEALYMAKKTGKNTFIFIGKPLQSCKNPRSQ